MKRWRWPRFESSAYNDVTKRVPGLGLTNLITLVYHSNVYNDITWMGSRVGTDKLHWFITVIPSMEKTSRILIALLLSVPS